MSKKNRPPAFVIDATGWSYTRALYWTRLSDNREAVERLTAQGVPVDEAWRQLAGAAADRQLELGLAPDA